MSSCVLGCIKPELNGLFISGARSLRAMPCPFPPVACHRKMESRWGEHLGFAVWCPSPSALCWEIRQDERLETRLLPRQTQGEQADPSPGASLAAASLLRSNPIQTLSSASPQ